MNLQNVQKLIKNMKELSPRDRAVLFLWNRIRGSSGDTFSKYLLHPKHVFNTEEEKVLTEFSSKSDEVDFYSWQELISKTITVDQFGDSKYMSFELALIDLRDFLFKTEEDVIYKHHLYNRENFKNQIGKISTPMADSFANFSVYLIAVIIHQYCLSDAFDEKGDLLVLDRLSTIRNRFEGVKSTFVCGILDQCCIFLLEKLRDTVDITIDSYVPVLCEIAPQTERYFLDNNRGVKNYVKKTLNQYLSGSFDLSLEPQPLFK
ncbi:MAG: hypothetical protein WC069_04995 [Candidatus Shapirobacteria bacterium]